MVDASHYFVEHLAQGGDIVGGTGFGAHDGCFEIGLALQERHKDACEIFLALGLDITGDCRIKQE